MKEISLLNRNNKFANDIFIHIAPAPSSPILESEMPIPFMISEKVLSDDKNTGALEMMAAAKTPAVKFEVHMIDFTRIKLYDLNSTLTYMSHGMDKGEFIVKEQKQYPGINIREAQYAIYVYKKIKK